ncbi:MAG: hypothetical protein AB7O21_09005 [Gammaproteobacteria bacterium]
MAKHQQLVTSLGATVVVTDAESDFLIAEHDTTDEAHLDAAEEQAAKPEPPKDFGSAVKSLLTSTTCHRH